MVLFGKRNDILVVFFKIVIVIFPDIIPYRVKEQHDVCNCRFYLGLSFILILELEIQFAGTEIKGIFLYLTVTEKVHDLGCGIFFLRLESEYQGNDYDKYDRYAEID